jgi:hypothetical protein
VKWAEAEDRDSLLREMLSLHFPAIVEMLREWKLNCRDAARLFGIGQTRMQLIQAEYRVGTFDLVTATPPTSDEITRSKAAVLSEIACRDQIENVRSFWLEMRVKHRISLQLTAVRTMVAATAEKIRHRGNARGAMAAPFPRHSSARSRAL